MNQSVPLSVVLVALAAIGVAYLVWRLFKEILDSMRAAAAATSQAAQALAGVREAVAANTTALEASAQRNIELTKILESHLAGVPKLLEAVTRIGTAQLQIMQAQRQAAANPFGPPNTPAPPRDATAANLEHAISEAMRATGCSREEAMMRLNGANDQSVWGDSTFENWR